MQKRKGDFHEVRVCKEIHVVSHLLFANDSFLFFRAQDKEALVVRKILYDYVETSR